MRLRSQVCRELQLDSSGLLLTTALAVDTVRTSPPGSEADTTLRPASTRGPMKLVSLAGLVFAAWLISALYNYSNPVFSHEAGHFTQ